MGAYFFNVTKTVCDNSLLTGVDNCRAIFSSFYDADSPTTLNDAKLENSAGSGWTPGLRTNPWRHSVVIDFWTRVRVSGVRVGSPADPAKFRRPTSMYVEIGVSGQAWRRVGGKYSLTVVNAKGQAEVKLEKAVSGRFLKLVFNDDAESEKEKPLNVKFDVVGCKLTKIGERFFQLTESSCLMSHLPLNKDTWHL